MCDHVRRRQQLERRGQPADGAVLPTQRGQPVPVPHLRGTTGQHVGRDREPRAGRRGHHGGELESLRRRRERVPRLRPGQPPLRDGGQLPGHDRGDRHGGRGGHQHHGGADPVPQHGRQGHEVPLQLERAHHLEPVGTAHLLSRRPGPAEDERHGQDVEGGVARPHAQREGEAGHARRPVHERGGRRRELRHAGLRGGIAPREGGDLDRQRRRPGARDPRRRRNVEERHAQGAGRVPRQRHRGLPVRQGHRLHRHHPLQVQRSRAGALQDDRLRRDVDEDRPRHSRQRLHQGRSGRRREARPALCRDRTRRVHLVERWPGLVTLPVEPADHARHRPPDPPGQPDCRDLGPLALDPRRPRAHPAVQERHAGPVPVSAGQRVPG